MKDEQWFLELEAILDEKSDDRSIIEAEALEQLEAYRIALIEMLFEMNEQPIDIENIESLEYKPLNIAERVWYITQDKYHYMRYQQMKTLRQEVKKLNAVRTLRKKREQNKK